MGRQVRNAFYGALANNLIPMAISLGFGIIFATAIILLLVPSLYLILEDLALLVKGTKKDRKKEMVRT